QPGPLLAVQHPQIFGGIIATYIVANVFMLLLMVLAIRLLAKLISAPQQIVLPIILMFCVIGIVSGSNRIEEAWLMLGFGVFGLAMSYFRFPLAPFVIGFVLGPLAEARLRSALMSTGG